MEGIKVRKDKVKRDGRAFGAAGVFERRRYLIHPSYELECPKNASLTSTGHLVIVALRLKRRSAVRLPNFEFRWDESAGELDVDPIGVPESQHSDFRKSKKECRGHHTVKIDSDPRVFTIDIAWYGQNIYCGVIGFSVAREVESKVEIGIPVSATEKISKSKPTLYQRIKGLVNFRGKTK